MTNRILRLLRNNLGQNVVEFALVVPLLLFVLMAGIDFGNVFYHFVLVNEAAREGARAYAVNYNRTYNSSVYWADDMAQTATKAATQAAQKYSPACGVTAVLTSPLAMQLPDDVRNAHNVPQMNSGMHTVAITVSTQVPLCSLTRIFVRSPYTVTATARVHVEESYGDYQNYWQNFSYPDGAPQW